jgi:hypothetical protein
MEKLAREIRTGDRFPSPRREEGLVLAVEDFGRCSHDDRPDSVHIRDARHAEYFIALIRDEELHVCDDSCPDNFLEDGWQDHLELNRHQR